MSCIQFWNISLNQQNNDINCILTSIPMNRAPVFLACIVACSGMHNMLVCHGTVHTMHVSTVACHEAVGLSVIPKCCNDNRGIETHLVSGLRYFFFNSYFLICKQTMIHRIHQWCICITSPGHNIQAGLGTMTHWQIKPITHNCVKSMSIPPC